MTAVRPENATYPVLRRAALATGAVFALSGAVSATWLSRLPEVRARLGATPGALGLALLASAVGGVLSTQLSGRLVSRFGTRPVIATAAVTALCALLALGLVQSVVLLGAGLFVYGFAYATWDVAMNVHGHHVEAAAGKPWMPRYHSAWSVGGFLAAGIGAVAVGARVPVPLHFLIAAVLVLAGVLAMLRLFLVDHREVVEELAPADASPVPPVRLITMTLVLMGVVMACSTVMEGAAQDWLGIYFDTIRHTPPAEGAAAYTAFAVAMAATRGSGTWSIAWLGRSRTVRLSALVALIGVGVVLESPLTAVAYVGAFLWGMGTAIVFPAVVSAAGDSSPGRSAQAIATVAPIGYSGFLVGPPLIGLLAERFGLGHSLWAVGALAVVMFVFAGATRERSRNVTA